MVLCPCFLFFCCTLFDPCLSFHPLQLILAEAKTLFFVKTASFQILSWTGSLFCSSKIVSKSTTNSSLEIKLPCSRRPQNDSFPYMGHWLAIYSAELLEKKAWQAHDKCLHGMDMQSHFSNFSFVYYTMMLLCSSSVSEFNAKTYVLTCMIPSPPVYPWFPFSFYYLVSLWFLLIPFKLAGWYLAASSALSLQLSSQHPQTHWLCSFFKCSSNPIFNQHTAAWFCLLFAYNFLSFIPLLTFCSYHISLQLSIALSILVNIS